MPSTYSSDLRLELMATGEQDATWGTKTNANLNFVEDAISGMATLSTTGGTYTLTALNATTDESRMAILKVTGALVSNSSVVVPAVTKRYTVWNATSGAYTVTVKTASGAGVIVDQGGTAEVFCDGTDVLAAGTDLGTPTSGVLTNCSGLPVSGITASTVTALGVGSVELGHASDTTLTRVSAGVVAVEGVNILLSTAIGSTVQAYDADLTTWAGITPGTGVGTALAVNVGSAGAVVVNGGALGTPTSGLLTNCTGIAAGLTAGTVTTNANLTGPITSTGNATAVAAQTGTGSTFVMQASPTLTTPNIGVATATTVNKVTLTAPVTGSTLTVADGKTLTCSNTLTFTGTDASSVAFGTGGTVLYSTAIGSTVQAYDADLTTWAGITPGTGVGTALAVNVGSAGAVVVNGGALGTPSSGTLTNCTGLPVAGITASTSTALGVGSVELGHATDTTLTRVSAGVVAIEGNNIVLETISATLQNKTVALGSNTISGTMAQFDTACTDGNFVYQSQAYGMANNALTAIKTATFNSQTTISSTSGAITVDWTTAQNQKQTEPTGGITYTFTAPPGPCHLQLLVDSDGTSTAQTITWPGTVIWLGSTWSGTNNKKAIINFWYDGTSYYAQGVNQV